jgi:hypothetical protein
VLEAATMSQDLVPLVYEKHTIRVSGDMLCLTDMWHAAKSPPNMDPRQWVRLKSTTDFIEHLASNVGIPYNQLLIKRRGLGGTLAHWLLAFSYAIGRIYRSDSS